MADISKFIDEIVNSFDGIQKEELEAIWKKVNEKKVEMISKESLSKLTNTVLVDMCKSRKLKYSGTKAQLIERLLEPPKDEAEREVVSSVFSKKSKVPFVKQSIIEKMRNVSRNIPLTRNKHGNYEHEETRLVFDKSTQQVIGKQGDDGNIYPLSLDDAEMCHKYKFSYNLPENLLVGRSGKIDEEDEEVEDDDDDVEIPEEGGEDGEDEDDEEVPY